MKYADYAAALNTLGEQIRNDKDIILPHRNYAAKLVTELQAMLLLGLTSTNREAPAGDRIPSSAEQLLPVMCSCPTGGMRRDCPVHGAK
jgi:hypothetical protein